MRAENRVTNILLLLVSVTQLLMRFIVWSIGSPKPATKRSEARVMAIISDAGTPLPLTSPMAK